MQLPNPTHRVWRDFKTVQLHIPRTILFPPGAGGNFILTQIGASALDHCDDTNEYISDNTYWFAMEADNWFQIDSGNDDQDCDLLYTMAADMVSRMARLQKRCFAACHQPPVITANVINYSTDEFIIINVKPEDLWIVHALHWYKTYFSTAWDDKLYMLAEIISSNRYRGRIFIKEFKMLTDHIGAHIGIDITATPIAWHYFLDCKADAIADPYDTAVFATYLSKHWVQYRLGWSNPDNLPLGMQYQKRVDHCKQLAGSVTEIDYRQLFFQLRLPNNSALSLVDKQDLLRYSENNLKVLASMSKFLAEQHSTMLCKGIADLQQDLRSTGLMVPEDGIEPPTLSSSGSRSTTELPGH